MSVECHVDCVLGPNADHPGYLEYRCIDGNVNSLPFPGEDRTVEESGIEFTLADERTDVLTRFAAELAKATGDGSRKRQAGTKPPWYDDDAHEAAVFSHLMKWKRGELVDPDSGAHPLVHAAWRCLAIACRESGNTPT